MADRAAAIRKQLARHKRDREQKDRAVPTAVEPDNDSVDLMAIKKKLATARALREQPSLASRAEPGRANRQLPGTRWGGPA